MLIIPVAVFWGACRAAPADLRIRMESYDPAERIKAVTTAARAGREDLVPAIVDRLDDEDSAVRMFAILSLERLTGTRRGYSYYDSADKRRAAIEVWRQYLAERAPDRSAASQPTALAAP